jgi:HEAT repeat protein
VFPDVPKDSASDPSSDPSTDLSTEAPSDPTNEHCRFADVEPEPVDRAARIAAWGLAGRLEGVERDEVRSGARDPSPIVRAAALAAVVRAAPVRDAVAAWRRAVDDPDVRVRRRAADLAPALAARRRRPDPTQSATLVRLLGDADVTVVEAAAWALGETERTGAPDAVSALVTVATGHADALAREAAVAALGAIGDPAGLPAVLAACHDKPAVRRRAVLALAPFEGPHVDAALRAALDDRDWQVRQAAEDLTSA